MKGGCGNKGREKKVAVLTNAVQLEEKEKDPTWNFHHNHI
jgi:hypothetical protein